MTQRIDESGQDDNGVDTSGLAGKSPETAGGMVLPVARNSRVFEISGGVGDRTHTVILDLEDSPNGLVA